MKTTRKKTHLAAAIALVSASVTVAATPLVANALLPGEHKPLNTAIAGSKTGNSAKTEDVQKNRIGTNAPAAATPTTSKPSVDVKPSENHPEAPNAAQKEKDDVPGAAETCAAGLGEAAEKAIERNIDAAETVYGSTATEMMENVGKNEASKGCLTVSSELLDLTTALPKIPTSWGDISGIVRKHAQQKMAEMKRGLIDRGCEIADQFARDSLKPVIDFNKRWAESVKNTNDKFGNIDHYVGGIVVGHIDTVGDKITQSLEKRLLKADESLKKVSDEIYDKYSGVDKAINDLDNSVNDIFNFKISDAQKDNAESGASVAAQMMKDVQAKIPPAPKTTVKKTKPVSGFGFEYQECDSSGKCQVVNVDRYRQVEQQWKEHNEAKEYYAQEIERIKIMAGSAKALGDTYEERSAENVQKEKDIRGLAAKAGQKLGLGLGNNNTPAVPPPAAATPLSATMNNQAQNASAPVVNNNVSTDKQQTQVQQVPPAGNAGFRGAGGNAPQAPTPPAGKAGSTTTPATKTYIDPVTGKQRTIGTEIATR
ncbi:hypothetical protein ACFBZI_11435 [Moraxella sp. ZJ142]|uniref:hypothetical protein n=1 Tax=Moraxella marmotae TaxID=3344520 RepID=UPI0035D49532